MFARCQVGLQVQGGALQQCPALPVRKAVRRNAAQCGRRTVVKVKAIAAPEKTAAAAADETFRAWTSPSPRHVAKRTDLKK